MKSLDAVLLSCLLSSPEGVNTNPLPLSNPDIYRMTDFVDLQARLSVLSCAAATHERSRCSCSGQQQHAHTHHNKSGVLGEASFPQDKRVPNTDCLDDVSVCIAKV